MSKVSPIPVDGECVVPGSAFAEARKDDGFDAVEYINQPRWRTVSLGLERTRELLSKLGAPQDRLRFVHVAGTNGKGSTCAYVASILQQAGFKVGLFTSPYIITFEERIRVNGENISWADLDCVTRQVRDVAEAMEEHPTEFELMTAVAFLHFAQQECDIVVAEVGLGGRLDSTNVIERPEVSVITNIGIDHVAVLGDTLEKIATEKAGIIKPGVPVVSWPQDPEALKVVKSVARTQAAPLGLVGFDDLELEPVERQDGGRLVRPFVYQGMRFQTQLLGSYQPSNAVMAIEVARTLARSGWSLSEGDIRSGIAAAQWPGRFQLVASSPDFVIDGGHNVQGAQVLAESLDDVFPGRRATLLVGVLADKQHAAMLERVLPYAESVVVFTPPNPRALAAADLAAEVVRLASGILVEVAADARQAVDCARSLAGIQGLVVAFGSLYSIGSIMEAL